MPTVVIAPDSFKGTLTAAEVAEAVAGGVRTAGGTARLCPVADGGEGTLEALRTALGGKLHTYRVHAPDRTLVEASFLLSEDRRIAVVETAQASGLHLVDPGTVDAFAATSAGTGELLAHAAASGAEEILLGGGGSGFSDGGLGALGALAAAGGLGSVRVRVLCDVTTPYEAAAQVYGPQKGADPDTVRRLTTRLHEAARTFPRDPRGVARTGAAGGLAGALWAVHDARLVSGIEAVLETVGLEALLASADAVVTGEGSLDAQTLEGKAVQGVSRLARRAGVPVYAVVGRDRGGPEVARALGLCAVHEAGSPESLHDVGHRLTVALSLESSDPIEARK